MSNFDVLKGKIKWIFPYTIPYTIFLDEIESAPVTPVFATQPGLDPSEQDNISSPSNRGTLMSTLELFVSTLF